MTALLVVLPPLIQVLSLAGGVHFVNYYRDALDHLPARAAANRAVQIGWLPCVLSAGTTAVGMASLMVSRLTPIRSFGAYSAAGVLITTAIVLVVVPTVLGMWKVHGRAVRQQVGNSLPTLARRANTIPGSFISAGCLSVDAGILTDRRWAWLTKALEPIHGLVMLVFVAVMVIAGLGLSKIRTSVRIETLFEPASRILSDYRWLESHVAPLVPIEVVLDFEKSYPASMRRQFAYVQYFDRRLASRPDVGGTLSAATFLPRETPAPPAVDSQQARAIALAADQIVASAVPRLTELRFLAPTRTGGQQWRIRGFVSAGGNIDYSRLLHNIESDFASILVDRQGNPVSGVTIQTTGIMPLVHRIQHQLMDDLQNSFLLAFAGFDACTQSQNSCSCG